LLMFSAYELEVLDKQQTLTTGNNRVLR